MKFIWRIFIALLFTVWLTHTLFFWIGHRVPLLKIFENQIEYVLSLPIAEKHPGER